MLLATQQQLFVLQTKVQVSCCQPDVCLLIGGCLRCQGVPHCNSLAAVDCALRERVPCLVCSVSRLCAHLCYKQQPCAGSSSSIS